MKTKEVILKLHLRSTSYEKIYFSFANYYIWLKCDFFNMVFGAHLFCFFCFLFFFGWCPNMCLYFLSTALWSPAQFPHRSNVRFVFTSSCLRKVVSNTFCVFYLFVFVLYALCYQFLWFSIFDCPLGIL
jgi:hypothetical protein